MPSFPRIQSPLWAAPFLLLLALSQPQTPADRIEFKLGRFQQITLFENKTFVVFLSNVPVDVTFIIIQVHTKYVNTLLSFHKITTTETSTGQDPALLQSLKPEETALMWHLRTPMENASAMSVILPYKAGADPVPGGCSMASDLTVDARVHLQYNLYEATISFAPANVGYARGTVPPLCDFAAEEPTLRLQYDVYQYFLPEADLTEKLLFASLQKMAKVDQVEANGVKLCSLGAQDKTSVTVSSIPGQGVIYNVIVKDPEMNTSAAYTPAHTYGCSFTDKLDNCYTLKRTSTRIFLVSVGLVGLFICFFGHRYLKTELFFFGFLLVGSVSFVLLTQRSALHYDANVKVFDDDAVFWVTFSSVALLVPLIFFSCPRPLNILACGFVGSYTVILAIHNFVFTSLAYITLNIVKRALHGNFKAAFTNVPFQTNDYILISVWVVLLVSGIVFQFHREKEQPRFPPHPYKTWKRDRERRQTNILDPSHHVPPIRDRVKSALTDVKHLFTKQQSAGEQTPLLL
ncbi:transmembrane 7 superfamily member 3 isoform X3 [Chiloscyllium plagiosum]|uniref:transmembrane 7 superfamily member 3 isoform X3 n=1 Tax=Chiloscyllium plagiosum TaxID=36176 RepID=UPI001CB7E96D|nr:transmembrane 7 superfamily member 3 isoform X3 [Chiloscyllium plagiosum]